MKLKIAIQKSGRLYEDSVQLLKECGIDLRNVKDRLKTESDNFPLEVFFLRDDDIPQYVEDGVAHIGIVGENVLFEKTKRPRSWKDWVLENAGYQWPYPATRNTGASIRWKENASPPAIRFW